MSKLNQRSRDAASWLVQESTFGTDPGSPTQIYPVADSVEVKTTRDALENDELRTDLYDGQKTVHGLRKGTLKWSQYLRVDASMLTAAATATTPWALLPWRLALGAEFPTSGTVTVGDTASASSASSVTVGDGTKFSKGTWIMPTVSSSYEPARVINIATNVLTLDPQTSATPTAAAAAVVQMYNHAPARSFSKSFSFRHALNGDAGLQWLARGCKMDSVELDLSLGAIPKATFSASITQWGDATNLRAPYALGYTATAGTNAMADPAVMRDCYLIIQAATGTSAARAAHYSVESASLKLNLGTEFVPDLGGVEGRGGVMRVAGRDFARLTVKARPDFTANADLVDSSYWTAQTSLQAVLLVKQTYAGTARWHVFDLPTCFVEAKPEFSNEGGRLVQTFTLRSLRSAVVTSPTEGNDFHYAPFVYAAG